MKLAGLLAFAVLGAATAQASDFVGIYGVISKVVFEPNAEHPQRVQVFGVFSIADNSNGSVYLPAQRGYLYFTLDGVPQSRQEAAVREWTDLKSVAGTDTPIAFSGRLVGPSFAPPRVRKPDEKPENPEMYRLGTGTEKMRADTNYPPISSLFKPVQ
jgi:hypothetical protein